MIKCDIYGAESKIEETYTKIRKSFWTKKLNCCPSCYSKHLEKSYKNSFYPWGILLCLGLLYTKVEPLFELGWLILNFCLLLFIHLLVILPHELGHVIAAKTFRFRVFRVIIGIGKTIFKRKVSDFVLEFKSIPIEGLTITTPRDEKLYRLKFALIILSGPLVNLLCVIVLLLHPSSWKVLLHIPVKGLEPLWAFVWANVLAISISLLPVKSHLGSPVLSDGWHFVQMLFSSEDNLRELLALNYALEGNACLEDHNYLEAQKWFQQGLAHFHDEPINMNGLGVALLCLRKFEEARVVFKRSLELDGLKPMVRQ